MIAREKDVDLSSIPVYTVDVHTRHMLAVSDVMDWLRIEGETEVRISIGRNSYVIADAVGYMEDISFGPVFLEVDLSNNNLESKARRYLKLSDAVNVPLLILVTHRPEIARRDFENMGVKTLVIPLKAVWDERGPRSLRRKILAS